VGYRKGNSLRYDIPCHVGPVDAPVAQFPTRAVLLFVLIGLAVRAVWLWVSSPDLRFPDEERFWCEALSVAGGGQVGCGG
jgi:hypothetical protein